MARRRKYRKSKKNALDYVALPQFDLDPDTKKSILIILILIFGAISLLSLFDLAGSLGVYIDKGLALAFGWGKWLFPIILLTLGLLLYNEEKYYIKGTNYLGLFLFVISFQPLLHFFIEIDLWQETVADGVGGGYLGMYVALIFYKIIGFWGSIIILLGLLLISLMLMLDTSLNKLIGSESIFASVLYPIKAIFSKTFGKKDENEKNEEEFIEEEEEEDEAEDEEVEDLKEAFSEKEVGEPEFIETPIEKEQEKPKEKSIWKNNHIKIDLPLSLLSSKLGKPTSGDIKNNAIIIQRTLENFGIVVEMGEISVGPTVTQYTFKPAEGVKLSRITTLNNDLALALAAHPIRIEAPIPGRSLVGIEVPNQTKAIVGLSEILNSEDFKKRKNNLMIALGKDVSGKSWMYDITKMPHMLVAGASNSGKSVCLNSIIVSLLYQNNPDDLRFVMVDPKRVELPVYNGIPHLLTPVITDVPKTINALKWCLNEMDRRFELLSKHGKRNIQSFNESHPEEKMPYIVFVIDELADLMVAASRDIEGSVIRLAQMARAVGIHLILATQRPSVDVITGLIKANMPARIAFSVASGVDSKTILDSLGAEKLLGQGDMLFITAEISKPKRLQGAYVSENEIKKITNYIKMNSGGTDYIEGVTERQKVKGMGGVGLDGSSGDDDELFAEAKEIVINMGRASASLLQRRLSVGYARAARIIDELEDAGIIGPGSGAKPREILISKEQYENLLSQGISGVSLHSKEETEAPDEYLSDEEEDDEDDDDDDVGTKNLLPGDDENGDDENVGTKNLLSDGENNDDDENTETENLLPGDDTVKMPVRSPEKNNKNTKPTKSSSDDEDEGMYFSK
jgi:S-DNA-T family DNA segregation ATPase FtsK/SpoIIIE